MAWADVQALLKFAKTDVGLGSWSSAIEMSASEQSEFITILTALYNSSPTMAALASRAALT